MKNGIGDKMVFAYAICKCRPALWDFRSKKAFRQWMDGTHEDLDQNSEKYFEINEKRFKFQRVDPCGMCGFPLKITEPNYTKKSILEWAKLQIGKDLAEKY